MNENTFTESLVISPEKLITSWQPQRIGELTPNDLEVIKHLSLLFIDWDRSTLQFPPITIYGDLINCGIGVEIMNTHAACRTNNALSAEKPSWARH